MWLSIPSLECRLARLTGQSDLCNVSRLPTEPNLCLKATCAHKLAMNKPVRRLCPSILLLRPATSRNRCIVGRQQNPGRHTSTPSHGRYHAGNGFRRSCHPRCPYNDRACRDRQKSALDTGNRGAESLWDGRKCFGNVAMVDFYFGIHRWNYRAAYALRLANDPDDGQLLPEKKCGKPEESRLTGHCLWCGHHCDLSGLGIADHCHFWRKCVEQFGNECGFQSHLFALLVLFAISFLAASTWCCPLRGPTKWIRKPNRLQEHSASFSWHLRWCWYRFRAPGPSSGHCW